MNEAAGTASVLAREEDWIDRHIRELKEGSRLAEKIDTINPKLGDRSQNTSDSEMKRSLFSQSGAPRLALIFLVLAVLGAGAFAFLFAREFTLRERAASQLTQAERERAELNQAVTELKTEVAREREEISRLVADLKAANAKADLVDTIRSEHEAELLRMRTLYEDQITSLRSVLEMRNDVIATFESDLGAIRELLEGRTAPARSLSREPVRATRSTVRGGIGPATRPAGVNVPSGQVLTVNPEHRFIVVSLGPEDGAEEGQFVQIYRGETWLGTGRIDRVYQNLSAATILSDDSANRIQEGDHVFLAL